MKPVVFDLFCGKGGWTDGFLDEGFRVIGYDIRRSREYRGELILQDVATIAGRSLARLRPAVIVASPPCNEFNPMIEMVRPRRIQDALCMVQITADVIRDARPRFWIIENSRTSIRYIRDVLGPPRLSGHAYILWGNFPGFILPTSVRLRKGLNARTHEEHVRLRWPAGKPRPAQSARIPADLARPLARAIADALVTA